MLTRLKLCVGDVVLVSIEDEDHDNDSTDNIRVGVIRYIGYIHGYGMSECIGLELVESIDNGHNGIINGYQYFNCCKGYGIHTKIANITRKLEASEIAIKMQEILTLFKSRLNEYVLAVSQRDEYIEKLKTKQRYLRNLLKESRALQEYLNMEINNKSEASMDKLDRMRSTSSDTSDIILFNPQKQCRIFHPSMNYGIKAKNTATTNTPFDTLTPITDITPSMTPRTSNASINIHNNIKKEKIPDKTPKLSSFNSSAYNTKSSSFYIYSEYANYSTYDEHNSSDTDCSDNDNDNEEQELCDDEYDADSSLNEEKYHNINNMYSPQNKSNTKTKAVINTYLPENKAVNTGIIPISSQQQKYVYIHHPHIPKQRGMDTVYLQSQQTATNGYMLSLAPSFSTPTLNNMKNERFQRGKFAKPVPELRHSKYSKSAAVRAPTPRYLNKNNQQKTQQHRVWNHHHPHSMVHNNYRNDVSPYYVQPQIEEWMKQQTQKSALTQQQQQQQQHLINY